MIAWWNWKQIKILQIDQKQKLKIKRIRSKVEISTTKRTTLKIWMASAIFKKWEKKEGALI